MESIETKLEEKLDQANAIMRQEISHPFVDENIDRIAEVARCLLDCWYWAKYYHQSFKKYEARMTRAIQSDNAQDEGS